MIEFNEKIKSLLVSAIKKTKAEIDKKYGKDKLFGYALCTDDTVMTIYHIACTVSWVKERAKEDKYIGYISVEWEQAGNDSHFDQAYQEIIQNYERHADHHDKFERNRNMRFEAMVQALKQCRETFIFDQETHLSVGSTDPSEYLEFLAIRAIDRINSAELANQLAKALNIEHYRSQYSKTGK